MTKSIPRPTGDRGSVLPLVLVFAVVLSVVVVALAEYAVAGLKYGSVVEDRADRLASADGGIRYGVEQLRLLKSDCFTALGEGAGATSPFLNAGALNQSTVEVTCQRIAGGARATEGWALVVTGGADPAGPGGPSGVLRTAGGSVTKKIGGRTYIHGQYTNLSGGVLQIENGDLWYGGPCNDAYFGDIDFNPPGLYGPDCKGSTWQQLFTAPALSLPTALAPPPTVDLSDPDGPCTVYHPGIYTSPTPITLDLTGENYFESGEYLFNNVTPAIDHGVVIAGYSDGSLGDTQQFSSQMCSNAISEDRLANPGSPGATFYLGGASMIKVDTQGEFEILRRAQGDGAVSIQTVDSAPYTSVLGAAGDPDSGDAIIDVKAGTPQDFAAHGLIWAPNAYAKFDNVANKAQGQALGGLVIGELEMQSPDGGVTIRIESSPYDSRIMLTSTATKDGSSTSIRAIAQVEPSTGDLAINSWRVCDLSGC